MSIAKEMATMAKRVTKQWTAQRKREERDSRARYSRADWMTSTRIAQKDVAWSVIPDAYVKASNDGTLPAQARQIFYAARGPIQDGTGRPLQSVYFTQHLLPLFINEHPETADWKVVYDARGRLAEPHTKENVPLGTLEVQKYLADISRGKSLALDFHEAFDTKFPTIGTANRVSAVLFIEKEGFNELFKAVKLAERYDLAIMSSKGQSVIAARRLVDQLCHHDGGVPLLILHDFDKSGLEIASSLTQVSDAALCSGRVRYEFENDINVIDLGVRLEDVTKYGLESEAVRFKGKFGRDSIATEEEKAFLRGNKRVELNAFTSGDFIKFIEAKLKQHKIKKVVPDDDVLEQAYRRAYQVARINERVAEIIHEAAEEADEAPLPKRLRARVLKQIKESPDTPWDAAVESIASEAIDDA